MIKITITDLLNGFTEDPDAQDLHSLYLIRDGDVVFYVGKSENVIDRLLGHLGLGNWGWAGGSDSLVRLIEANLPQSLNWQIELLTVEDCKPYITDGLQLRDPSSAKGITLFFIWERNIKLCEQCLIAHYHPCLNIIYNQHATPLPERYRSGKIPWEKMLKAHRRAFRRRLPRPQQTALPGLEAEGELP
jgi:hypothetical protein